MQGLKSGDYCVTVLIQDEEMIVSNLGNCKAFLCTREGVAKVLTSDHKAETIENQGGYVAKTRKLELEEDMEFLVLTFNGLWDVVSNQEAADTMLNVLAQEKTPKTFNTVSTAS
ncbi:unnamed protein product [Microthlaspi erraticum]|uniref:PPM-type phosphatase domain-containing protein n=1 Tax=Microthlaspi erraticum TaxID=1685480 RepID=A0A6D2HHJ1_9BRAS|nr:unnamed protein product [Microthlaspi erraticum]